MFLFCGGHLFVKRIGPLDPQEKPLPVAFPAYRNISMSDLSPAAATIQQTPLEIAANQHAWRVRGRDLGAPGANATGPLSLGVWALAVKALTFVS